MSSDRRWFRAAALVVAAFWLANLPATGQQEEKRFIKGQVLDEEGTPVALAVVHLKNRASKEGFAVITNKEGRYQFTDLSTQQDYEIYAEFEGKKSRVRKISQFDTRARVFINLRLKPEKPEEEADEEEQEKEKGDKEDEANGDEGDKEND